VTDHVELRRGVYHDSVTLLRIAQAAAQAPGVTAAQVAMATPLNVDLTVGLGFSMPAAAGPNDLLVALRGDDGGVEAGLAAIERALTAASTGARSAGGFGDPPPPRTVRSAARAAPDAAVVLLSVPGSTVLGEAMDAIEAGRHVMIFSDNVPIEHEIVLKEAAAAAGVLVMGPDCGTAVIGGVGLGFANVLSHTAAPTDAPVVGVIAASGTGAQQLTSLLDEAGVAISQVIGLGGRDLSERVGGRSALAALRLLDDDPNTGHIVVVSKPPHPATGRQVTAAAADISTPVTVVLLGAGRPDITSAAEAVLDAIGVPVPPWPRWLPNEQSVPRNGSAGNGGALRGLFSGGTLADEAMVLIEELLGTGISSNIPLRPERALPTGTVVHGVPRLAGLGNVVIDLGDDEFTRGRPHPMIDPTVKLDLLADQAADPDVRVILLDVVLGHCAEEDPSARLAPVIRDGLAGARRAGRPLDVVVSLCGTTGDPQDRERQAGALAAAGACVYVSNAAAARCAAGIAAGASNDDVVATGAIAGAADTADAGAAHAVADAGATHAVADANGS